MPELPEVEITARRIGSALEGAEVESALAPGMVALKTFDPPLSALTGMKVIGHDPLRQDARRPVRGRRRGAARPPRPPDVGGAPSGLRQARIASRQAPRASSSASPTAASCGCASSARSSAPGRSCCARARSRTTRWSRRSAPRRGPPRPCPSSRRRSTSRGSSTRSCATSARSPGSGASGPTRSCGRPSSRPSSAAPTSPKRTSRRSTTRFRSSARAIDHYEEVIGDELPNKMPLPLKVHKKEGEPCPRCGTTDRGRLLLRAPGELLPRGADRRQGDEGPPAVAAPEVAAALGFRRRRLLARLPELAVALGSRALVFPREPSAGRRPCWSGSSRSASVARGSALGPVLSDLRLLRDVIHPWSVSLL